MWFFKLYAKGTSKEYIGKPTRGIFWKMHLMVAVMVIVFQLGSAPAWSESVGPFVKKLSDCICVGQQPKAKGGCDLYFYYRLKQYKTPDDALTRCQTRCEIIHGIANLNLRELCKQGCQFVRDAEQ